MGTLAAWLTTGDVAKALQVSARGVRWLVAERQIAATRTASGQWLFHKSEVLNVLERRAVARVRSRTELRRLRQWARRPMPARQLRLPLFSAVPRRKVTTGSGSEPAAFPPQIDASPISGATLPTTHAHELRMARATLGPGHRAARGHRA